MDLAGNNNGIPVDNLTTDNSSVVVDTTTLPLNAARGFFSSNDNGSYAKYGDNLTLRFTSQQRFDHLL